MVMCWVPGCKHYNNRETCKFFQFPKPGTKERLKWLKLIRRDGEPGAGACVCSCHFHSGKKENLPDIFHHNRGSRFGEHYLSPEKKSRKKGKFKDSILIRTPLSENINEPVASTSKIEDDKAQSVVSEVSEQRSCTLIEAENYFLKKKVEDLKQFHEIFTFSKICHDNKLVLLYTGLPDTKIFNALYNLFEHIELNYYHSKVLKVPKIDQLLLTLMKLRLNPPHKDLAFRFNCAESVVSNIFITWLRALHEVLFTKLMAKIPSTSKNQTCLPSCFNTFSNCRIILDCTEVYTAISRQSMSIQKATYSTYKHRNTWKGLVGVAPNGVITFVSKLYPGGTSDKKIVQHCGILDQLEEGDLVLADKGFLIRDILPPGVSLNIPPFLTTSQFTEEQVRRTESIAKARVHVERAIRRMKCFSILHFIPETLVCEAEHVFQVVGALTNFQYPLIKEVEEYYN